MKQNSYKSFAILLVVSLLLMVGVWIFLFKEISINKGEASDILQQIETQKEKDANLSSVRSLVSGVKNNVAILDSNFVYSDEIAGFVETLEREASQSQVTLSISNLTYDETSTMIVKPLTAHVDIDGTWQAVIMFIGRIERFPKAISVDRISLRKIGDVQAKKSSWSSAFDIQTSVIDHSSQ